MSIDVILREQLFSIGTNIEFYRPTAMCQLFDLRKQFSNSDEIYFIAGNTGETFDAIVHQHRYSRLVHLTGISELQQLSEQSNGLSIGACVTISQLKDHVQQYQEQQLFRILSEQLDFNADRQVRNQATVGGHVLNHSRKHTSDLLPIFYVCQTKLRFVHLLNKKEIEINIQDIKTTDLNDLLLVSIFIPFLSTDEFLQSYKQAHRRKHDTGIVTGAFRLKLNEKTQQIQSFNMAFGGFGDGVILVPEKTRDYVNKGELEWTKYEVMTSIKNHLLEEIQLDKFSENGQPEYR